MNVLITGANGQLGTCLRFQTKKTNNQLFFTDIAELDISDSIAVNKFVDEKEIDIIVNCAAYTNVERAESEFEKAQTINAKSAENLALAIKRRKGLLIHISTDYVFGGNLNNIPYKEDQPTNPTGAYGKTKLQGEEAVLKSGCRYIILRTSWLYSEYGRNFVKTMIELMKNRKVIKVVFDQIGTPTYAHDLAATIIKIIENPDTLKNNEGIYHYSNEGVTSWYDFAKEISKLMDSDAIVLPCHSNEFQSDVTRPSYSVLDKTKIKETFCLEIPYWRDSLERCIDNLKISNN